MIYCRCFSFCFWDNLSVFGNIKGLYGVICSWRFDVIVNVIIVVWISWVVNKIDFIGGFIVCCCYVIVCSICWMVKCVLINFKRVLFINYVFKVGSFWCEVVVFIVVRCYRNVVINYYSVVNDVVSLFEYWIVKKRVCLLLLVGLCIVNLYKVYVVIVVLVWN